MKQFVRTVGQRVAFYCVLLACLMVSTGGVGILFLPELWEVSAALIIAGSTLFMASVVEWRNANEEAKWAKTPMI